MSIRIINLYIILIIGNSCSNTQEKTTDRNKHKSNDLSVFPIETVLWKNNYLQFPSSKFIVMNVCDSSILIRGYRSPKMPNKSMSKNLISMYGRDYKYYFVLDYKFRFYQQDKWAIELEPWLASGYNSFILLKPGDSIELWGEFISGLSRFKSNRVADTNKLNFNLPIDSIGFALSYTKLSPKLKDEEEILSMLEIKYLEGLQELKLRFKIDKTDSTFVYQTEDYQEFFLSLKFPENFENEIYIMK